MAIEPEEGEKQAQEGRLKFNLLVRADARRKTITSDGALGLLFLRKTGRRQMAILHLN
jgi:hypothetical protein